MKTWRELLMLYLTQELNAEDRAAFEKFLAEDATCRAELEEWRTLGDAVRDEADVRIDALPKLPASFYQRLQTVQRSPNGKHAKDKTMTTIAQPLPKSKANVSATMLAAVVAMVFLAGALLLTNRNLNNPDPASNNLLTGMQQEGTTPSATPMETFTPTPVPALMAESTATPFPAQIDELQPTFVPTVPPPAGVVVGTESLVAPVISEPALLLQNLDLQGGYGTVTGLDVSADGNRLVVSRAAPGLFSLWLVFLDTAEEVPLLVYDVQLVAPQFNADGTQVIVGTNAAGIFVLDISGITR